MFYRLKESDAMEVFKDFLELIKDIHDEYHSFSHETELTHGHSIIVNVQIFLNGNPSIIFDYTVVEGSQELPYPFCVNNGVFERKLKNLLWQYQRDRWGSLRKDRSQLILT